MFDLPPHHDTHPLDLLKIDWLRVLLDPPTICRIQAVPRDEDALFVRVPRSVLRRKFEVALICHCRLFPTGIRVWRK
jgi:hypothetical protein